MKEFTKGLYDYFTFNEYRGGFWQDVGGRLFDTEAPQKAQFPYAVYFIVSDVSNDTFSERIDNVSIQFSLFSNASGTGEIKDMETHLADLFKNKAFTVEDETIIEMWRLQANGPYRVPADTEEGTGAYWQMDVDYEAVVQFQGGV
jgi:hypothetical protein